MGRQGVIYGIEVVVYGTEGAIYGIGRRIRCPTTTYGDAGAAAGRQVVVYGMKGGRLWDKPSVRWSFMG